MFLNNVGLSVAGVLITLCPFFFSYELLVVFSAIFGLASCKLFQDLNDNESDLVLIVNSLHYRRSSNFTGKASRIGKRQQWLQFYARVLRSGHPLRNSYCWYGTNWFSFSNLFKVNFIFYSLIWNGNSSGLLYDIFGDYHVAFYLAGSSILLSAFICYPLGMVNRWEKRLNSSNWETFVIVCI